MSNDLDKILSEDLDDELDELVKDLTENPPTIQQFAAILDKPTVDLNSDATLEGYINMSAQKSNNVLLQVILNFANTVGDDPDRAAALAALIKSNVDILKVLGDQLNKNRDNITKLAVQKMKSEGDIIRETISKEGSVVTSRDDMFRELFKEAEDAELVDEDEIDEYQDEI
jgi:hypothetical protein